MTDDKPPGYLLFLVSRGHHNLASRVFQQIGFCRGQPPVLFEFSRHEGIAQMELAENLEVTQATLTNLLNRMEISGLINRVRDTEDGRVSHIYLTESGRRTLAKANDLKAVMEKTAFDGFSLDEQKLLTQYLEKIHTNLNRK